MKAQIKHYSELSRDELYAILQLRIAVFIVEQNCPYHETDDKDQESYHLMLWDEKNKLIGVTRILPPGLSYPEPAIGRVATSEAHRHLKLGHELMKLSNEFCLKQWPLEGIRLSAQSHLTGFYEKHGYVKTGKHYLEDDIPHDEMLKSPDNQQ